MQGLKERNQNIIRNHNKKSEKDKVKSIHIASHASTHTRTPPKSGQGELAEGKQSDKKVGLDEEEMLFLARRCLAEELMTRPNVPAILSEMSTIPSTASNPTISFQPVAGHSAPSSEIQPNSAVVPVVRAPVLRRNSLFQLHRLGVGLVVIKFGWIWVSCGGLIVADSMFCTSDIFMLVFRRIKQHFWKVGTRLHEATRDSMKLFTEEDE
jgi:hypothetical protein